MEKIEELNIKIQTDLTVLNEIFSNKLGVEIKITSNFKKDIDYDDEGIIFLSVNEVDLNQIIFKEDLGYDIVLLRFREGTFSFSRFEKSDVPQDKQCISFYPKIVCFNGNNTPDIIQAFYSRIDYFPKKSEWVFIK